MATNWQLTGTDQIIATVRQSGGAIESIDFTINDDQAFSILGGYITVLTLAGGSTCDVQIGTVAGGFTSILKAAQASTALGSFALDLDNATANLKGASGDKVRIAVLGGAAQVQVTLFISQASPATLA
jgi:hypothetical protein